MIDILTHKESLCSFKRVNKQANRLLMSFRVRTRRKRRQLRTIVCLVHINFKKNRFSSAFGHSTTLRAPCSVKIWRKKLFQTIIEGDDEELNEIHRHLWIIKLSYDVRQRKESETLTSELNNYIYDSCCACNSRQYW